MTLLPTPHPQSFPVPFSVSPLPLPHPWQPLTCFLSLVLSSLECHLNRVIASYHLNRTGAFESGCVIRPRCICQTVSSFLLLTNVPLYGHTSLLLHLSADGHSSCFQVFSKINQTAVDIYLHAFR